MMSFLKTAFQHHTGNTSYAIRKEKEEKCTQKAGKKRIKLSACRGQDHLCRKSERN